MLIISRKTSEQVVIAGTIEVTVLQVRGGKVRLGISAPSSVRIQREEVRQRMELERRRKEFLQPAPDALVASSVGEQCVLCDA